MTSTPPPAGPTPPTPEKQALLEAFDTVLKSEAERRAAAAAEAARPGKRRSPTLAICIAILLGLGIWLGVGRPEWLFVAGPPPESAEVREASLRMVMYQTFRRVQAFRIDHGRLPRSLAEAGARAEGITYVPVDTAAFRIEGVRDSVHLTLDSRESTREFIGNSYDVLLTRGAP